jgi:hypothetical protein
MMVAGEEGTPNAGGEGGGWNPSKAVRNIIIHMQATAVQAGAEGSSVPGSASSRGDGDNIYGIPDWGVDGGRSRSFGTPRYVWLPGAREVSAHNITSFLRHEPEVRPELQGLGAALQCGLGRVAHWCSGSANEHICKGHTRLSHSSIPYHKGFSLAQHHSVIYTT